MHNPWRSSLLFHKWPYRDVNKTLERVIPGELYFMLKVGVLMKNWVLPGSKYLEIIVLKLDYYKQISINIFYLCG